MSDAPTIRIFAAPNRAIEAAAQWCDLVNEVSAHLGGPPVELADLYWLCDGCDARRTTRQGWHHAHGHDYCPSCLLGGER